MMNDDDEVTGSTTNEVPEDRGIPATEIAKAVRKAKKPKAKAGKKASAKAPAKASKAPKGKKAPKAAKKKAAKAASGPKRGPKGLPESKRVRHGTDADVAFGKRIAAARKAKGLAQWQLAEKLGITQPAMCNIEKATSGAGQETHDKLVKILHIKPLPAKEFRGGEK